MNELITFDIACEVYRAQRRPAHAQLVLNDDYHGICVIDILTGKIALKIAFPDGYATTGVIDSWCLRADGDAVIAFQDEDHRACWFSLLDRTSHIMNHPPWPVTSGMPYDWRGDIIWAKDPGSFRFAVLRAGATTFQEDDGLQVSQENREWRRALDRMRRADARCLRVEPEHAHLLFVALKESGTQVGIIGWVDQTDLVVSVDSPPPQIAAHHRQLFMLQEYEAIQINALGDIVRRFPVSNGFRFVGLDTVPVQDGAQAVLVLVSTNLDGGEMTRFTVYPVSEGAG
jgi:hypothetical protein